MASFRKTHKAFRMLRKGTRKKYSRAIHKMHFEAMERATRPARAAMICAMGALQMGMISAQWGMTGIHKSLKMVQIAMDTAIAVARVFSPNKTEAELKASSDAREALTRVLNEYEHFLPFSPMPFAEGTDSVEKRPEILGFLEAGIKVEMPPIDFKAYPIA